MVLELLKIAAQNTRPAQIRNKSFIAFLWAKKSDAQFLFIFSTSLKEAKQFYSQSALMSAISGLGLGLNVIFCSIVDGEKTGSFWPKKLSHWRN